MQKTIIGSEEPVDSFGYDSVQSHKDDFDEYSDESDSEQEIDASWYGSGDEPIFDFFSEMQSVDHEFGNDFDDESESFADEYGEESDDSIGVQSDEKYDESENRSVNDESSLISEVSWYGSGDSPIVDFYPNIESREIESNDEFVDFHDQLETDALSHIGISWYDSAYEQFFTELMPTSEAESSDDELILNLES